jgi:hypothetical protein
VERLIKFSIGAVLLALLAGCKSSPPPSRPVVDAAASLTYLEDGIRPEELLFPKYLLTEDFELNQHGRIPDSNLVGAGLKSELSLKKARQQLSDVLAFNGWKIDKMEMGKQFFRILALKKDESLEIRGVQGSGLTRVFILYVPGINQEN